MPGGEAPFRPHLLRAHREGVEIVLSLSSLRIRVHRALRGRFLKGPEGRIRGSNAWFRIRCPHSGRLRGTLSVLRRTRGGQSEDEIAGDVGGESEAGARVVARGRFEGEAVRGQ